MLMMILMMIINNDDGDGDGDDGADSIIIISTSLMQCREPILLANQIISNHSHPGTVSSQAKKDRTQAVYRCRLLGSLAIHLG